MLRTLAWSGCRLDREKKKIGYRVGRAKKNLEAGKAVKKLTLIQEQSSEVVQQAGDRKGKVTVGF